MVRGGVLRILLVSIFFAESLCSIAELEEGNKWTIYDTGPPPLHSSLNLKDDQFLPQLEYEDPELHISAKLSVLRLAPGFTSTKTLLLDDGSSENTVSYILSLPKDEVLVSLVHKPTNPKVLTKLFENQEKNIPGARHVYNITLRHQFEGSVGTSGYQLTVITDKTEYKASGMYYIAGIQAFSIAGETPFRSVTGLQADPIVLEHADLVTKFSNEGQVPLRITYQPVGPDVTPKPPSLLEVMQNAQIFVKGELTDMPSTLVNFGNSCNPLGIVEVTKERSDPFRGKKCGIVFDKTSKSIFVKIEPERSGTAVISIRLSKIEMGGDVFDTEIRIIVRKSDMPRPVILIPPGTDVTFDNSGSESFVVEMYNTIPPIQKLGATEYLIDLPGGRYAKADFARSKLVEPVQLVTFVILPPGSEDPKLQDFISAALNPKKKEVATPEPKSEVQAIINLSGKGGNKSSGSGQMSGRKFFEQRGIEDLVRNDPDQDEMYDGKQDEEGEEPSSIDDLISEMEERQIARGVNMLDPTAKQANAHTSNVLVKFPQRQSFVVARNALNNPLNTRFAPSTPAIVRKVDYDNTKHNVLVVLNAKGYSTKTFTEHKSQQVGTAVSKEVWDLTKGNVKKAKLVGLENAGSGVTAKYHVLAPQEKTSVTADLMKRKEQMGKSISKQVLLEETRVEVKEVMTLTKPSVANVNGVAPGTSISGVNGGLVAAIVILVAIVSLPGIAFLYGYVVIRRSRDSESSGFESSDTTPPERSNDESVEVNPPTVGESSGDLTATSAPTVKDNFGRVDEESYASYKMEKEMYKEGYFGDHVPPDRKPMSE